MIEIGDFFSTGKKDTVLNKKKAFSHAGPWELVSKEKYFDRWYVGDFSAAEYTLFVDYSTLNKEIFKFLVLASRDVAKFNIYSRLTIGNVELVDLRVLVNKSFVDVIIKSKSPKFEKTKFIYAVNYFENLNNLE